MAQESTRAGGRYPALDHTTRWVPSRCAVPTSEVVWQRGRLCVHRGGVVLLVVSALLVCAPVLAGALIDRRFADSVFVAMALACAWSVAVAPVHHELAHAAVARHHGIEVTAVGLHLGGAYVVLHPPSTGVALRGWIWTLSAGPISNAVVGATLLVGWAMFGGGWFNAGGLFCMLVGAIELCSAAANGLPSPKSDGRVIVEAMRMARSPLVT